MFPDNVGVIRFGPSLLVTSAIWKRSGMLRSSASASSVECRLLPGRLPQIMCVCQAPFKKLVCGDMFSQPLPLHFDNDRFSSSRLLCLPRTLHTLSTVFFLLRGDYIFLLFKPLELSFVQPEKSMFARKLPIKKHDEEKWRFACQQGIARYFSPTVGENCSITSHSTHKVAFFLPIRRSSKNYNSCEVPFVLPLWYSMKSVAHQGGVVTAPALICTSTSAATRG